MRPAASSPRHTLITLTRRALGVMLDELVERLHAAGHPGVRPAHSRVFENLDLEGTRLTVLAERAEMTHPSMSELVTSLERLGYLERASDPGDGRVRLIRYTPAGRALQRHALTELAELEVEWDRRLGPIVAPDLATALHRLADPGGAADRLVSGRHPEP